MLYIMVYYNIMKCRIYLYFIVLFFGYVGGVGVSLGGYRGFIFGFISGKGMGVSYKNFIIKILVVWVKKGGVGSLRSVFLYSILCISGRIILLM